MLDLNGLKGIVSFDAEEFLISTDDGQVHIKGKDLTIAKMDTDNGILQIRGQIDQVNYLGDKKVVGETTKKENFFTKLFK